jgi:hypothetical protein
LLATLLQLGAAYLASTRPFSYHAPPRFRLFGSPMQLDFEVQRCTRRCAVTERPLEPGDVCYSLLELDGAAVIRKDYSLDAWPGPSQRALGWWKSRIPEATARKIKLAPNDVLLELFEQLSDEPQQEDLRYVLALLLLRRRVLRLELPLDVPGAAGGHSNGGGAFETMVFHCPKRGVSYAVMVAMPSDVRIDEIQKQLSDLLIAGAE